MFRVKDLPRERRPKKPLRVLLINPYIYDVSAYSFWSAPLGLLQAGSILRENGMDVSLLDCLPEEEGKRKEDGRAPFVRERVETPEAAKVAGKRFRRYGLSKEEVRTRLSGMAPPDLVLLTCIMTYWYQGAEEIVRLAREVFPRTKIVVGGIYASLCYDHARRHLEGADLIVRGGDLGAFYRFVEETFSRDLALGPGQEDLDEFPYPAFDLYERRHFVPLLTSSGCVYRCTYCAAPYLHPRLVRRQAGGVLREIMHWRDYGISRFVLYDDNFLASGEALAKPLLRAVARLPFEVSIYNPNALNASLVDEETAMLLRRAHFREVRLGLETIEPSLQRTTGGKVSRKEFEGAIDHLAGAGFPRGVIHAYVLAGLPLQRHEHVRAAIDYVADLGIKVSLAEYTPIPHTAMFGASYDLARYPIAEEPLFQNNALFPFAWAGFTEGRMNELKAHARLRNAGGSPPTDASL